MLDNTQFYAWTGTSDKDCDRMLSMITATFAEQIKGSKCYEMDGSSGSDGKRPDMRVPQLRQFFLSMIQSHIIFFYAALPGIAAHLVLYPRKVSATSS